MNHRAPLVLVDGSSYLYRAYHALPPLTTRTGQPTGAIKGVVNMLRSLLKQVQPTHVAVVFDAPGKTFRDDIYPEYKSHRPPMPEDMRAQIQPLHALVQALGLPLLCVPGVEADDVIGTLAQQAQSQGWPVLISTGDKDLAQLVNEHVSLVNTMTSVHMDPVGVFNKFGVHPEQIIDYLMLVGDSSDGIPGVPSVGPKTAVKWLQEHGNLATLIAHQDNIKGKVGEKFRDFIPQFGMTRELVTIRCDVPLDIAPDDLHIAAAHEDRLADLYEQLEFRRWAQELKQPHKPTSGAKQWVETAAVSSAQPEPLVGAQAAALSDEKTHTTIIRDRAAFDAFIVQLKVQPRFAFDTETTSQHYMEARLVGMSFCWQAGQAWYLPLAHTAEGAELQVDKEYALSVLKPILMDPRIGKVLQHGKYDRHVLRHYGIELAGMDGDTMLASYVLDATATRHNLEAMAQFYLGRSGLSFEEVAGKGAKQVTFDRVAVDIAGQYAGEDADFTWQLALLLEGKLAEVPALLALYRDVELPVSQVLCDMEHHGTLISAEKLRMQSLTLASRMLWLEREIYQLAGEEFNLSSPKQLGVILFEKLGITGGKKTASGQYATGEDILEQLDHPMPQLLLEHRSLAKLRSTYTDKLPQMMDAQTGRVHTSYHQAVTATGRLSSSDPNLQNIPIRTEEGRRIRQAFVAPVGSVIMAADYSQIELRIMAHLSGDPGLINAFRAGQDVHRATAAEVLAISLDEVTAEQRRAAKAVNFGLIYGMSAFGLAKQLHISRAEAQDYIARYFARYTGVQAYMERIREQAHSQGYVETLMGRRLMLPDIRAARAPQRQAAERAAINAPMQGTAADIVKCAMIRVSHALQSAGLQARMVMQVHDELVLEVPASEVAAVRVILQREMPAAGSLSVPLEVEIGVGQSWDEAH